MQAAKLFGANDVRVVECAMPAIAEDEILIKTSVAALCGSDLRMIANGYKGVDEEHPLTLGHEFCGVICQVGSGVEGYRVGMKVAVAPNIGCGICDECVRGDTHLCANYKAFGINMDGGFAEYVRIGKDALSQGNVMILGEGESMPMAAMVEPLSCVLNGQEQVDVRLNDTVLVVGSGPIGMMHAMLAKTRGASRVFMSGRGATRLEYCAKLDPWLVPLAGDDLLEQVMERTQGRGVDVCIIACPSEKAQAQSLSLMATNGRILFFGGLPAGKDQVVLPTNLIHYKQLRICGSTRANVRQYRDSNKLIAAGRLDLSGLVSAHYPLASFAEAVEYAKSGKGMKTIIVF